MSTQPRPRWVLGFAEILGTNLQVLYYVINVLYCLENAFVSFVPDPRRGSASEAHWGTSVPRLPVPTVPPNPGYTTICNRTLLKRKNEIVFRALL